jgi:hypothetical protein
MPDPAIATPFMKFLARVMSRIVPKLPVDKLPAEHVSSDAQVVAKYCADPLIYRGGMRTNWAWQFLLNMVCLNFYFIFINQLLISVMCLLCRKTFVSMWTRSSFPIY